MNKAALAALVLFALTLAGSGASAAAHPAQAITPAFHEVPTVVCRCVGAGGGSAEPGAVALSGRLAPAPIYDEQIGTTFAESFSSLAFNVTAVEQTDPVSQDGPAYLLNGLTSAGYWYQVGVSWNWNPGNYPGTGFDMNYEVFNAEAASVFPFDGSGGLLQFSGQVNQGDSILLNLYFSSGAVVMVAHDWNTGATATEEYSAEGSTVFEGDSNGASNGNGFFTGLMTEWYHPSPYTSNEKEVVYSEDDVGITSAWLWMDEYNPTNLRSVFANATSSPVSFASSPAKLVEFASDGATEYMNASELITGAMNATTVKEVPLTLSYSVVGGGTGYSPPVLQYVSGGVQVNATLSTSQTVYKLDPGSRWSVTASLQGSTATERWETDQGASGQATAAQTTSLTYYHQYEASVSYLVKGEGGTAPGFDYTSFGAPVTEAATQAPVPLWGDAGSAYTMTDVLQGSNSQERWVSNSALNGTLTSPVTIDPEYYQQFQVTAEYSVVDTVNSSFTPPIFFSGYSMGSVINADLETNTQFSAWLDAGTLYTDTSSVVLRQGAPNASGLPPEVERWLTNSTGGTVVQGLTVDPVYVNQYYVRLQSGSVAAGSVSGASGWYDGGSKLEATAASSQGWEFEYWQSSGSVSQDVSTDALLSVPVDGPVNDTAVFYPGLTIAAGPYASVSYSYPSTISSGVTVQGTVPAGQSAVIYVPPSGVRLAEATSLFLYSFKGWSGVSTSKAASITLSIASPASVSAETGYNYLYIGIIAGAVLLVVLLVAIAAGRGRKTVGGPAA